MEKPLCAGQRRPLQQTPPATCCLCWGSLSAVRVLSLFNCSVVFITIFSPETFLEKNVTSTNKMKLLWMRWCGRREDRQAFQSPRHTQTHTKTHTDTYTYTHTKTHIDTHTQRYMYTGRYTHINIHTDAHTERQTHRHIHIHTKIHTQTYTHTNPTHT